MRVQGSCSVEDYAFSFHDETRYETGKGIWEVRGNALMAVLAKWYAAVVVGMLLEGWWTGEGCT